MIKNKLVVFNVSTSSGTNESRILREFEAARNLGFETEFVVCCRQSHENDLPEEETKDGLRILRLRRRASRIKGSVFLKWMLDIIRSAKENKADFIVCHAVLLLPVCWLLTAFSPGKKLIYDAHELETESMSLVGHGLLKVLCKLIEFFLIRSCSVVFVVSESIYHWYKKRYPNLNLVLLPNYPLGLGGGSSVNEVVPFYQGAKKFTFLYHGNLCVGRGVEIVIEAFKKLPDRDLRLVFMGYGELTDYISNSGDDRIILFPAVSPAQVINYAKQADVGLSIIEPLCLSYHFASPNKLYEYLSAGLPVIVSDGPDQKRIVESYDAGKAVTLDVNALSVVMHDFAKSDLSKMKENALRASRDLIWDRVKHRYIDALSSLMHVKSDKMRSSAQG